MWFLLLINLRKSAPDFDCPLIFFSFSGAIFFIVSVVNRRPFTAGIQETQPSGWSLRFSEKKNKIVKSDKYCIN